VPGEQLGRLGRHAGAGQIGDERLAQGVEVGILPLIVLIRQERRLLATLPFLLGSAFLISSRRRQ